MTKNSSYLSKALRQIVWEFGPKGLEGECCENLSMPEFLALERLMEKPNSPVQEIGFTLGFTKSGATRVVNRLEKKGYIQKIKSNEDARVCCLMLTPEGEETFNSISNNYSNKLDDLLAQLPDELTDQVVESLMTLSRILK